MSYLGLFLLLLCTLVFALNRVMYRKRKPSLFCSHEFRLRDLKHRDNQGLVRWSCHKCKKEFVAENGLKILNKGKCIGD